MMSAPKRTYKIAAIPADGVGREVVAAGIRVLDTFSRAVRRQIAFEWTEFGWGRNITPSTAG
jgi:tartrate dehydrogenase/decarboxylase/D-malate dehydrogenase